MKTIFEILLFVMVVILLNSCSTIEPPLPPTEPPKAIKLNLIDVSCTEAFINVNAADTVLPVNITLKKDNTELFSFTLTKADTVVIDTTLQPNITYTYQTTAQINAKEENGDTIQAKALPLTSHNFTWQKFTFGIGASSVLRDVAIIDENNIWAVGEIYADTTGQAYNAVHWDGTNWTLKKIYYYGACSAVEYPPLKAIYAFSSNNIVITNGGSIGWFDGNSVILDCGVNPLLTGSINKIWGISSNDLYIVGNDGNIAHYQNGVWSKIESGTNLNIVDIWGDTNPFTNKTEIICGAANIFVNPGSDLIRIKDDFTTEILDKTGMGQTFAPLWFKSGIRYYVVGGGLYKKTYKDTAIWIDLNQNRIITQYFMECIRGSALNNIIVAGAYGEVLHFNGQSWVSIKNAETELNNGSYYRVAVKGNVVVAVGYDQNKGVVLIGHHQ